MFPLHSSGTSSDYFALVCRMWLRYCGPAHAFLCGAYQGPECKADFNRTRKFTVLYLVEGCYASRHLSCRCQTRQLGSDFTSYHPTTGAEAIKGRRCLVEMLPRRAPRLFYSRREAAR